MLLCGSFLLPADVIQHPLECEELFPGHHNIVTAETDTNGLGLEGLGDVEAYTVVEGWDVEGTKYFHFGSWQSCHWSR
jgi:hypothetical protein